MHHKLELPGKESYDQEPHFSSPEQQQSFQRHQGISTSSAAMTYEVSFIVTAKVKPENHLIGNDDNNEKAMLARWLGKSC